MHPVDVLSHTKPVALLAQDAGTARSIGLQIFAAAISCVGLSACTANTTCLLFIQLVCGHVLKQQAGSRIRASRHPCVHVPGSSLRLPLLQHGYACLVQSQPLSDNTVPTSSVLSWSLPHPLRPSRETGPHTRGQEHDRCWCISTHAVPPAEASSLPF
jgi:hypothetical protein